MVDFAKKLEYTQNCFMNEINYFGQIHKSWMKKLHRRSNRIRVQCTQIGWSYITRIGLLAGRFLGEELESGHSTTFWNKV